MEYQLIFDESAEKDLQYFDAYFAVKLIEQMEKKLCFSPLTFGEYLSGELHPHRKLRIGDCRVVYRVDEVKKAVLVFVVGKRKDNEVYKIAMRRLGKN